MPTSSDPRDVYVERRERCLRRVADDEARSTLVGRVRLATFALALLVGWLALRGSVSAWLLLLPIAVFVALVIVHERIHGRIDRMRRAIAHYDDGLCRIDGTWEGRGNARTDLVAHDHPYARDLDLFGRGSVFELLCTARTIAGERELALWLAAPAERETLLRRRAAIVELTAAVELREDLASLGHTVRAEIDPDALTAWAAAPSPADAATQRRLRIGIWIMPPVFAATVLAWAQGLTSAVPVVVAFILLFAVHRLGRGLTAWTTSAVERPARELAMVADLLARLETVTATSPLLVELRGALITGDDAASRRIRGLCRRVEWLQLRQSQLLAIPAWLLCWSEHFTLAIEHWRTSHGAAIAQWFAALGRLEALAALSARTFEQPQDVWPELVDDGPVVTATALSHPLLARDRAIANDVSLGEGTRDEGTQALMISGSNMAGKSTYMRAVGVNVVLALAGAPVRAASMRTSTVQVAASIRIEDSLRDGASRFFAEITRLRQVVGLAEAEPPVLFLLDEILHGTNSHDRRVGARAVLGRLLDLGAIGMMTTHDLALATDVLPEAPRVRNVHLCDTLVGDRLVFDYRLREGIVETSNALALMRAVGLHV